MCAITEQKKFDDLKSEKINKGIKALLDIFKEPAKCVGDSYKLSENNNLLVAFCFDDEKNLQKFNKLLADKINSADFEPVADEKSEKNSEKKDGDSETEETGKDGKPIEKKSSQATELYFSNGHEALEKLSVIVKKEGLAKSDKPDEYYVFYRALEEIGGKKCQVLFNLPVVPLNFLDNELFNPNCVIKLKYNKIDTYIGSTQPNCANIMKEIRTNAVFKCNEVINENKTVTKNVPDKGIWSGFVYFLRKVQGKPEIITEEKALLKVNDKSIDVEVKGRNVTWNYLSLKWSCNNDGGCSLKQFFTDIPENSKDKTFGTIDELQKKILDNWRAQIPDTKSCSIFEFYDEIIVLCPRDISEERYMKLALSVAIDLNLVDKGIEEYSPSEEDNFKVLYSTEKDKKFREISITLDKDSIKDDQGASLIEFSKVEPIDKAICGVEFRKISLPLYFSELNPNCCARILTDRNHFICTSQQSKCYIQLRQMILKIRKLCLDSKGLNKIAASGPKGQKDFEVAFTMIDNFKLRGEASSEVGTLNLGKESVEIKVQKVGTTLKYNYETLNFLCDKSKNPCTVKEFQENQDPYFNPDTDKIWMQSSVRNFFSKNPNIKEEDCMILISFDSKFDSSTILLVCSVTPDQGEYLRNAIADSYKERIKTFKDDSPQIHQTPYAMKNKEFDTLLFIDDESLKTESEPTNTSVKVAVDGLILKNSGDYLFKYDQLIDYSKNKVNLKYSVEKSDVNPEKYKIDESCCFFTKTQSNTYNFCLSNQDRCYFDKSILFNLINKKANKKMNLEISKKKRMKDIFHEADDPFDFGLKPNYKQFGNQLNKLTFDTLDISKNGIWHGWVFYAPLTDRKYSIKVSPIWMEIEDGIISLKTDYENQYPFQKLFLHEYIQICDSHCQANEYLEKKMKTIEDYEDIVFLKKTINNIISQLIVPFDEEPCTVLDFVNPLWGYGHSHIICAVDKLQGSQIRETINISYYENLLNMDIDVHVKMPYLETDKYFGKILLNGEIQEKYNKFHISKDGLVGLSVNTETDEEESDVDPLTIAYKDISSDNFGTECAVWYKNLKIKERDDKTASTISDNNCCFKFFYGQDKKKAEVCTFKEDGGICIKESRELMKGIRTQCLENRRKALKIDSEEVETMVDVYTDKTIDDSDNGSFEGFVNIGSAIKPSQALRQVPFFIKVQKKEINIYADHNKLDKPDITINTDDLLFSCKDSAPCKPSSYKTYLHTSTKNSNLVDSLRTTYSLFKDTFSINEEAFDTNCFILEDQQSPYLVCPVNPKLVSIVKKAIIQAYSLNYSCKQITAPVQIDSNMIFPVKIFTKERTWSDNVKVTSKGVILNDQKVLFDIKKMDSDSVTGSNCAIWFKELPHKIQFPRQSCCFAVSVNKEIFSICSEEGDMCIGSAYKLLKSIWNNCKAQDGSTFVLQPSPDGEVLGQTTPWTPKLKFDPAKAKFDVCEASRETKIFDDKKLLEQEFYIDNFNDIAYSDKKTLYKGWFKLYPLQTSLPDSNFLKLYGELSPENFIFYSSDKDKTNPKVSIRPDLLSMSCGFKNACEPFEFLEKLDKYDIDINKEKFKALLEVIEFGSDDGCAVIQRPEKESPQIFFICVHVRKNKTNNPLLKEELDQTEGFAATRNKIASFYGTIVRKIVYDSYLIARKFMDTSKFPEHEGEFAKLKFTNKSESKEVTKVKVTASGVIADGKQIINYSDMKNCNIKINIMFSPKDILYNDKQQCCLRYKTNTKREYICFDDINCESETLRFANLLRKSCEKSLRNVGNIFNDLSGFPIIKIMPIIKTIFQSNLSMSNPTELNPIVKPKEQNPNEPEKKTDEQNQEKPKEENPKEPEKNPPRKPISTQAFITKNKTIAIKYFYLIKKIIHEINLSQPYDSGEYPEKADSKQKYEPEFFGKTLDAKYSLTIADDKRIYTGPDDLNIIILGDAYFIKHKEFEAVISPKNLFTVLKYKKDNVLKLLFVEEKKLFLTTNSKYASKHPFLKGIQLLFKLF